MFHSKALIFIILSLGLILSACTSVQVPGLSKSTSSQSSSTANLAAGTLSLEGSSLSITQEQAKELLPLWKGVQSLSDDNMTAAAEINALYNQIAETLTSEQIQAIQNVSQADITALLAKSSVGANNASQVALEDTQESNANAAGTTGIDMSSGTLEGSALADTTQTAAASSIAPRNSSSSTPSSSNVLLAGQVIELLQQRASAVTA